MTGPAKVDRGTVGVTLVTVLLLVAALGTAGWLAYPKQKKERPSTGLVSSSAIAAVLARAKAAHRPSKVEAIKAQCKRMDCACARAAAKNGLDVDAATEALAVVTLAERTCPVEAAWPALRAEAMARSHLAAEASGAVDRVLSSTPNDPNALYAAGLLKQRAGHSAEALDFAERAGAAGRGAAAQFLRGMASFSLGNMSAAADAFRAAIALEPDYVEAIFNLALVAQRVGRYGEARAGYLKALRLDPSYQDARYNLAVLAHSIGATNEAGHHLEKLEALKPSQERLEALRAVLAKPVPNARPAMSARVVAPALSGNPP